MEITQKQQNRIEDITKKYDLKLVLLFGSQVNGRTHSESDIDIAVLPEKNLTFEEEVCLNTDLINVLGNVDLVNLRIAPPLLMKEIIDGHQIIYEKEKDVYIAFEIYARHRYLEIKPLLKMQEEKIENFIHHGGFNRI